MDKGMKKIWMAVAVSVAVMMFVGCLGIAVPWASEKAKSYIAEKAMEQKTREEERKTWCIENDFPEYVTNRETGEVTMTGCEKFKKPEKVTPQKIEKEETGEETGLHQIRFNSLRPAPYRDGGTPTQQEMISYAWEVSHGDEKFITMIEAESKWDPWAVEKLNDGSAGDGFGLCQVDYRYWPKIHHDPKFRTDWKYQVRTCYKLWRQDVTFYGAKRNSEMISRFWWGGKPEAKG
uniref:Transglycosylase SLT domain-containing protein n=1 Tax=candidate division CPR3 bacterium TaxID=2268181 RepID=A0A7C4M5M3_UNCC3